VVGANGGLYALRADEWRELPAGTIVDDLVASMRVVLAGRRVVYEPGAGGVEEAGGTAEEFRRRVRIATGNFQALGLLWPVLFRSDFSSFALWGHKVVRWSAPAWMLAGWLSCGALLDHPLHAAAFVGAPVVAALAWLLPGLRGAAFVRHFLAMNAALAVGFARCVAGRGTATWQRTGRTGVPRTA
jgi:cellulose synthase/poly-beta-1,6-N-acetylglucosamine synthase-like glycosyltransferase